MNKKIARFMKREQDDGTPYRHIHATGSFGWRWMPEYVKEQGVDLKSHPRLDMREYIYDMPQVMAAADLIIRRAGARFDDRPRSARRPRRALRCRRRT